MMDEINNDNNDQEAEQNVVVELNLIENIEDDLTGEVIVAVPQATIARPTRVAMTMKSYFPVQEDFVSKVIRGIDESDQNPLNDLYDDWENVKQKSPRFGLNAKKQHATDCYIRPESCLLLRLGCC